MAYVVIDIETVPLEFEDKRIVTYLMRKNFPHGLHPAFSKIVAIGMKCEGSRGDVKVLAGVEECALLRDFWDYLANVKPECVVTFNGYRFDVPFLLVRSYFNELAPSIELNRNKWQMYDSNHFDCLWALVAMNEEFLWLSLEIACLLFGIAVPENYEAVRGSDIERLYKCGDWKSIKEHCTQDVLLTEQLYLRLRRAETRRARLATEKQVRYILDLARRKGIALEEDDVRKWTRKEATEWLDLHK
jgi:predicted PolB exonuclease-like 3'-5' exonuclease